MKRLMILLVLVGMLCGCALKKPYVGRTVYYRHPLIARVGALPELGEVAHKPFKITFGLYKVEGKPNTYRVNGKIYYNGPGVFTRYYNGTFTLIIVKDGVIVDSFNCFYFTYEALKHVC